MNDSLIRFESPIGRIEVRSVGNSITAVSIARNGVLPHDGVPAQHNSLLEDASSQITEYLSGSRKVFSLPISLGGTPFQRAVWQQISLIPWGETLSYGDIARAIDKPLASRAIGGAVGANPIPLLIGCHRVLGSDKKITGYSGGDGIPTKRALLALETIEYRD